MQAEVFTVEQIASNCSISSAVVRDWITQGKLKSYGLSDVNEIGISAFNLLSFFHENNLPLPAFLNPYSRHVLIAEDEMAMAKAIHRVLRSGGFTGMIAGDGFQAGSVIECFAPAVLILDLNMPEMKGIELLQYLRVQAKYSHIRILVLSAAPETELIEARALGADDVMVKPFDNDDLLSRVAALAGVEILTSGRDV